VTSLATDVQRCFYRAMGEERRIENLEKRVDEGLAAVRSEGRADFRFLVVGLSALMLAVLILGFAAVIAAAGG
jgi:hypothetical protein